MSESPLSHTPIDWEKESNPPQLEAVTTTDGPLLVLAGAGSGKTRVITYRLAYLHRERGIAPGRCLAVTFTNKAADEMGRRAQKLSGDGARFFISTFHSFCARLLRRYAEEAGLVREFVILDTGDVQSILGQIVKEMQLPREALYQPRDMASGISYAKNHRMDAEAFARVAKSDRQERVAHIFGAYTKRCAELGALDFDDLLSRALQLLETSSEVLGQMHRRFEYIMVDEYQDTNHVQDRIADILGRGSGNLCVVGDDDQLIYAWRGASPKNILEFHKRWPEAKVVRLEENYRSTETILTAANALLKQNKSRHGKKLWTRKPAGEKIALVPAGDEQAEAKAVVTLIREALDAGRSPGDIAIFYRTNAQSRPLEEQLLLSSLPYQVVGGLRFYERKEIKDILAYLRLLSNPSDDLSFQRIVNIPRRGIGQATTTRLEVVGRERNLSLLETAHQVLKERGREHRVMKALGGFVDLVDDFQSQRKSLSLPALIRRVVRETGYREFVEASEEKLAQSRLENLEQWEAAADELVRGAAVEIENGGSDPLTVFLERVSLLSDVDEMGGGGESLLLMTAHTAKGLEFPVVFVTGMEEAIFPHAFNLEEEDKIEEERRLFYVAMTRAKERLYLCHAFLRYHQGRHSAQSPSRFLAELPPDLLETMGGFVSLRGAQSGKERLPVALPSNDPRLGFNSRGAALPMGSGRPASTNIHPGDRVRHRTFGAGRVLEVSGDGEQLKVTVDFVKSGVKTVVQKYAKLEKLA